MGEELRITLVQADQQWENKLANFSMYKQLLPENLQTDILVLPEMFHTCFTMRAAEFAETMEHSTGIAFLKELSKKYVAAVYTSLIIQDQDRFYNRGVWVTPDGKVEVYDKRKRFGMAGEDLVFAAGEKEKIVHYNGWKINLQICYDLRFPENVRNGLVGKEARYDLVLYVANWPERRATHWRQLLVARAIENQCFVAGVNRVGVDGNGLNYRGDSMVVDALGETLSTLKPNLQSIETVVLMKSDLEEVREKLPFLKDSDYRSFEI
jgi:predicted amidohydrolase